MNKGFLNLLCPKILDSLQDVINRIVGLLVR